MPRKIRDVNLETTTARRRLKVRADPYWRILSIGKHVGYRRNSDEGAWLERRYVGGKYLEGKLAAADDLRPANGITVLDFFQALEAARTRWQEIERQQIGGDPSPGRLTVRAVLHTYFAHREQRGSKGLDKDRSAAAKRVVPMLGNVDASKLTAKQIADWHAELALTIDADRQRAKRATANRVLTILKAALNHAFRAGLLLTDVPWRTAAPFKGVDKAGTRYLSADECVRLVNACGGGYFRDLVQGALLTGCRFGELTRMFARDFHPESGSIFVRESRSGKSRYVALTD